MKKILVFLMAALLVVSMLAACGKKNNADATQPAGEDTATEGTTGANEDATTPTDGNETTQPTGSNIEVGIETGDEEDSTEGGVIDFDDLLDAAD